MPQVMVRYTVKPDRVAENEALVRAVCAVGDDAASRLQAYREKGADLAVVYPVPVGEAAASIEGTLAALAHI